MLSVALSLGSPPAGVTRHPRFVEPGLSSASRGRNDAAARPPGRSLPSPSRSRSKSNLNRIARTGRRSRRRSARPPAPLERLDRLLAVAGRRSRSVRARGRTRRRCRTDRRARASRAAAAPARYWASRSHGNSSPGSILRCGATSEWPTTLARGISLAGRCRRAAAPARRSARRGIRDSRGVARGCRARCRSLAVDVRLAAPVAAPACQARLLLVDQADHLAVLGMR